MSSVHTSLTALVMLLIDCFVEHQVPKQVSMCIEHRRKLRALEGSLVLVTIDVYIHIIRSLEHLLEQGALDVRFGRMHQFVHFQMRVIIECQVTLQALVVSRLHGFSCENIEKLRSQKTFRIPRISGDSPLSSV